MDNEAVVVESQPTMEVERGPLVNMTSDQRNEFRITGKLPEPPKADPPKEESAPSPETPKVETAAASEPAKQQEHTEKPKAKTAEERIAQLEATIEKIRKGAGIERKTEPAAVPEPKSADKEPTPDDTNQDGTLKFKTYEEFYKALARWEVKQELAEQRRIEAEQAQARAFNEELVKARSRYENFDEVVTPFATAMNTDPAVSPVVRQMMLDSEVLSDLLYTIGSDPAEAEKFVRMSKETPGKALRYIALTESLIREELEVKSKPADPPAPPKTQAPKPPAEVGGRAASPGDPLESAVKANDFRAFKAEANRRELARLKG